MTTSIHGSDMTVAKLFRSHQQRHGNGMGRTYEICIDKELIIVGTDSWKGITVWGAVRSGLVG